jgi:hypothetical protein
VAETAASTRRAARLAMVELAVARAEVDAVAAVDVVHAVIAELKVMRKNSTSNSVSADGGIDNKLKLAREAV